MPRSQDDGVTRLARALYGRPETARDHLGGSDAKMLHDAAERIVELEGALTEIERRLREDTGPIIQLINAHGDRAAKNAWKQAVYASAIRAQVNVASRG